MSEELLENGLIEKVEHSTNRRVRLVALTESGWDALAECSEELRAREERLSDLLGPVLGDSLPEILDHAAQVLAGGYFGDADAEAEAVARRRRPPRTRGLPAS